MIPRYLRIVYYALLAGCLLMAFLLVRGCRLNQEHIAAMRDQSPIPAPSDLPDEQVSVAEANDIDGTVSLDTVSLPLPADSSQRARVLLARVLANDALPASNHPLPSGPAIADVFFVALPLINPADPAAAGIRPDREDARQMAVINLTKSFAAAHPSGVLVEDLTLRQLIATLQANFSQVDEVRFLVDGQPADTLAGHQDLSRAYAVSDPTRLIHTVESEDQ